METVNVFFGGSVKLEKERNLVKALANHLSAQFDKYQVHVVSQTFKELGDNQEKYISFLAEKADLALFVVKEQLKPFTADELTNAVRYQSEKGKPRVHVFWCAGKDEATNAETDKNLRSILGTQHAVSYQDLEELENLCQERILQVIMERLEKQTAERVKKTIFNRSIWGWAVAAALTVFGLVYARIHAQHSAEKTAQDIVLAIGGGSVSNFIKEEAGVALDTMDNVININIASESAYNILREEGNRNDLRERHVIPVIMSAQRMKESVFELENKNFKRVSLANKLSIVEFFLGKDPLIVYAGSSMIPEALQAEAEKDSAFIDCKQLALLLRYALDQEERNLGGVYATSEKSGTRNEYVNSLGEENKPLVDAIRNEFHHNTTDYNFTAAHKLYLGCKYFSPHDYDAKTTNPEERYTLFWFVDAHRQPVEKDMFLYIPAYGDDQEGKTIPPAALNLLRLFNPDKADSLARQKFKSSNLIISDNDYLDNSER